MSPSEVGRNSKVSLKTLRIIAGFNGYSPVLAQLERILLLVNANGYACLKSR